MRLERNQLKKIYRMLTLSLFASSLPFCAKKGNDSFNERLQSEESYLKAEKYTINVELPQREDFVDMNESDQLPSYYKISLIDLWGNCGIDTITRQGKWQPGQILALDVKRPCKYLLRIILSDSERFELSYEDHTISYDRDIEPILKRHCVYCHSPDSGRTTDALSEYRLVYAKRESIKNYMLSGAMPPAPQTMYPDDIAIFKSWVDQGSPVSTDVGFLKDEFSEKPWVSAQIFIDDERLLENTVVNVRGSFRKAK